MAFNLAPLTVVPAVMLVASFHGFQPSAPLVTFSLLSTFDEKLGWVDTTLERFAFRIEIRVSVRWKAQFGDTTCPAVIIAG